MAVRGDEVASSIDAHVRDAIERMVGEIRSSVEDVRAAVDSQLKAALQSVQADVNAISFLPHIQKSIGELAERIKADIPPPRTPKLPHNIPAATVAMTPEVWSVSAVTNEP